MKLALGLPAAILLCMGIGGLVARTNAMPLSVLAWMAGCGLLGALAGHLPFEGYNLASWLADSRLWGVPVYEFGPSPAGRTTLLVIFLAVFGIVVGVAEVVTANLAWERTTADKKLGRASWAILALAGLAASVAPALFANAFINQPLRDHQILVSETVRAAISQDANEDDSNYRSVRPFLESTTQRYKVQLVSFGLEESTWDASEVDVLFNNGFVLRCSTFKTSVVFCSDFSNKLAGWMDDLVTAGRTGEQPWLERRIRLFAVEDGVYHWLLSKGGQMGARWRTIPSGQTGGWAFMSARFDSGFEMTCRFTQAAPVRADLCFESGIMASQPDEKQP